MHHYAADVAALQLDLAGVDRGPDLEADAGHRLTDLLSGWMARSAPSNMATNPSRSSRPRGPEIGLDLLPDGAFDPVDQVYQAPPNLIPGRVVPV